MASMLDTPDLSTIRAFLAVADAGSFSTATHATGLSRSALGKALARLEARLGTRLLHRTTRRVTLTTDGAHYLERVRKILMDLAEVEAGIQQDRPRVQGVLKLSLPDAYGRLKVLPILQRFMDEWPELTVEIALTDRSVDLVEEGVDLAVRIGSTATNADLMSRVVDRSAVILCAAPDYLRRRGTPNTVSDLAVHDRIEFGGAGVAMRWMVSKEDGSAASFGEARRILANSAEAIRDMTLAGLGIAELPAFLIVNDLTEGRLVALLTDQPGRTVDISILYANKRHLPVRVRLFIDRLVSELVTT